MSNPTIKHPSEYGCLQMIGFVFFIWTTASILFHFGIDLEETDTPLKPFLPNRLGLLLAINAACGALGGFLVFPKRPVMSISIGTIISAAMTGFAYVYFYFRGDFFFFEVAVPAIFGIVLGLLLPRLWSRLFDQKTPESKSDLPPGV